MWISWVVYPPLLNFGNFIMNRPEPSFEIAKTSLKTYILRDKNIEAILYKRDKT